MSNASRANILVNRQNIQIQQLEFSELHNWVVLATPDVELDVEKRCVKFVVERQSNFDDILAASDCDSAVLFREKLLIRYLDAIRVMYSLWSR